MNKEAWMRTQVRGAFTSSTDFILLVRMNSFVTFCYELTRVEQLEKASERLRRMLFGEAQVLCKEGHKKTEIRQPGQVL